MPKRFEPERLSRQLAPRGFVLNLPEVMKGGISFIRPSSVERLYEHVRIVTGKVAWAETLISGAAFTSCHRCVSEEDDRFRAFLSEGALCRTTELESWADAQAWQNLLVENADKFCKLMSAEKGPALAQRLNPTFSNVDAYLSSLGNLFAIFDREFAFASEIASDEQAEVARLAEIGRSHFYLNSEDAMLASIALVRYGHEVEGDDNSATLKNWVLHGGDDLGARLVLLADYVRSKRTDYDLTGGLRR